MNTKEILNDILGILEEHNNSICELQNHVMGHIGRIKELESLVDEQADRIKELESLVDEQADRIRNLQNRVNFLEIKGGGGKPPGPVDLLSRDPYVYKCENMC